MDGINEKLDTIVHAINWTTNAFHAVVNAVTNPVTTLQHAGLWAVVHGEIFVAVAIVGILLWLFGLHVGKRMAQWSVAVFALVAILSGVL